MYKKNKEADGSLQIRHSGVHHDFDLQIDKYKNLKGNLAAYGDNSYMQASIDEKGKLSGRIVHSGGDHSEEIILNKNGTWQATLSHKRLKGDISFKNGKVGKISTSIKKIPFFPGNSHNLNLNLDSGLLSGKLDFKNGLGTGSIKVSSKGKVSGKFEHKSGGHEIGIELSDKGEWKATFSAARGKMCIEVEKGKAKAMFSGNL